MKGFIRGSEEFNPKGIEKEDLLECIRKGTICSPRQH